MSGMHSQVECVVSMRRVNHLAIRLGPQRAARIIMAAAVSRVRRYSFSALRTSAARKSLPNGGM